jgi:hypothetical protein
MLQVDAAQPAIDAAGGDSIDPTGQDGSAGLGEHHGAAKRGPLGRA